MESSKIWKVCGCCVVTPAVFLHSAAWWQPALRCQHATIQCFLIKNPGLVLIRRTPAAALSSTACSDHDSLTTCDFVHPQTSFCALRAAELLLGAPVKLNYRPWPCAVRWIRVKLPLEINSSHSAADNGGEVSSTKQGKEEKSIERRREVRRESMRCSLASPRCGDKWTGFGFNLDSFE